MLVGGEDVVAGRTVAGDSPLPVPQQPERWGGQAGAEDQARVSRAMGKYVPHHLNTDMIQIQIETLFSTLVVSHELPNYILLLKYRRHNTKHVEIIPILRYFVRNHGVWVI